tara:strand:+ start:1271 stop:1600 length:330 start_codon:yes stop_codon:yes gene_type:complete
MAIRKKPALNDSMDITINIKWLVQLVFFIVSITTAFFTINSKITRNESNLIIIQKDTIEKIERMEKALIKYEEILDSRVARLEDFKDLEVEAVNRSLLSKVLGTNKGDE